MSRRTLRLFTVTFLLMSGGLHALAEPASPSENVTVTGTKSREVLGSFTKAFASPTKLTGKIARWERRVCPVVVGQNPNFTAYITQRVKYVALAAGAPVNTEVSCAPNIEIVFTTTPQALVDNVRENNVVYLGYATSTAQLNELATVTRPIQAWYTTETVDQVGMRRIDRGRRMGPGIAMSNFNADAFVTEGGGPNIDPVTMLDATYARSSGSHIDNGIHSAFNHILIVVDSTKLVGQKIVPLADYISILALTQLNSLNVCQQLPSIVNILAADCDHSADGLTLFDLAYLQGLYKMSTGRNVILQRNEIVDTMVETATKSK